MPQEKRQNSKQKAKRKMRPLNVKLIVCLKGFVIHVFGKLKSTGGRWWGFR